MSNSGLTKASFFTCKIDLQNHLGNSADPNLLILSFRPRDINSKPPKGHNVIQKNVANGCSYAIGNKIPFLLSGCRATALFQQLRDWASCAAIGYNRMRNRALSQRPKTHYVRPWPSGQLPWEEMEPEVLNPRTLNWTQKKSGTNRGRLRLAVAP
jgi:hypothetical protein